MNPTLAQAVQSLGTTEEEVYQTLKARGIKGMRGDDRQCPIALYLTQILGYECSVGSRQANTLIGGVGPDVSLPVPVQSFVRAFDIGVKYQDLLKT